MRFKHKLVGWLAGWLAGNHYHLPTLSQAPSQSQPQSQTLVLFNIRNPFRLCFPQVVLCCCLFILMLWQASVLYGYLIGYYIMACIDTDSVLDIIVLSVKVKFIYKLNLSTTLSFRFTQKFLEHVLSSSSSSSSSSSYASCCFSF